MLNVPGVFDATAENTALASGESRAYIGFAPGADENPVRSG
jgi:hypothetical protein